MPTPILYAHPFSSYCWKALIALWENQSAFEYRRVDDEAYGIEWQDLSPTSRMPLLVDGDRIIPEATIIIEYMQLHHPGPAPMLPPDPEAAIEVRLLDRMSDNYLMTPLQAIVFDRLRDEANRDPYGVELARRTIERAYAWWNARMTGREWASETFSLADCATAPALFYADWAHPIPESFSALRDYRARLLARPTVARAVDEARPFRSGFPLGDPGRD